MNGRRMHACLARALTKRRPAFRIAVTRALRTIGHATLPRLLDGWWDEDYRTREAAADALAKIGDQPSLSALRSALDDSEMQWPCAVLLAKLGDIAAVPAVARFA